MPAVFRNNNLKSYTLVELLLVVALVGALAGAVITIINFPKQKARAQDAVLKKTMLDVATAIETYKSINGEYPGTLTDSNIAEIAQYITTGDGVRVCKADPDPFLAVENLAIETGDGGNSIMWIYRTSPQLRVCLQARSNEFTNQYFIWVPATDSVEPTEEIILSADPCDDAMADAVGPHCAP